MFCLTLDFTPGTNVSILHEVLPLWALNFYFPSLKRDVANTE